MPGVHLISLQKGIGAEQLAAARFPVKVLGADLDEVHGAFMDTAAVMRNLDLIIAADTAVGPAPGRCTGPRRVGGPGQSARLALAAGAGG